MGVIGTLASTAIGSSANKSATNSLREGDANAIKIQNAAKTQELSNLSPYTTGGAAAQNTLSYLLGTSNNPNGVNISSSGVSSAINPLYASTKAGTAGQKIFYDPTTGTANLNGTGIDTGVLTTNTFDHNAFNNSVQTAIGNVSAGNTGTSAAGAQGSLLKNFTSADLPTDDGYQFTMSQGLKALQRSQAANGTLNSGAAAKALDDYTQGLATNEYQNAKTNYDANRTFTLNSLTGQSTTGLNATNSANNAISGNANNVSDLTTNAAKATSDGTIQGANILTSGISSINDQLLAGAKAASGTGF